MATHRRFHDLTGLDNTITTAPNNDQLQPQGRRGEGGLCGGGGAGR